MKISVITACFNAQDTIRDTLLSVLGQKEVDLEYIVVDGGSADKTVQVIQEFADRISVFISEKDKGIYDALNKGIDKASGDVIAILHADDIYTDEFVLAKVMKQFHREGVEAVYGDLQYVDRTNTSRVIRNWRSGEYYAGRFRKGWMPPHPAFFLRRECYLQHGKFDLSFTTAADYELMLRMIERFRIKVAYLPEVLVKMRIGGVSNASWKNRIKANREDRRAWKVNGLTPGMFTLIRKPLSKIRQFF